MCGTPGGDPFLNVTRPDVDGNCPDGTSPCIGLTSGVSAETTVCYAPDDHASSCPITDIQIVENTALSDYTDNNYTPLDFNSTASLVYSTKVA